MIVLAYTRYYLELIATYLEFAAVFGAIAMGVWALVDAALRSDQHFVAADKRTKGFWLGVNAAGLAVIVIMGWTSMFGLLGVVANAVYLVDVRPALNYYRPVRVRSRIRRPGRGGSGRGRGRR